MPDQVTPVTGTAGSGATENTQQAGQVQEHMVPKTVLNDYIERAKAATEQFKTSEQARLVAMNNVTHLQTELERAKAENEFVRKNFVFTETARKLGVQDPADLYGHVDLAQMKFENGSLVGLQERLSEIQKNKPYLFAKTITPPPTTPPPAGAGSVGYSFAGKSKDQLAAEYRSLPMAERPKYNDEMRQWIHSGGGR